MLFAKTSARQEIVELSKLVEEYGYDAVWAGDSILAKPRLDSIAVLSAAAGVTQRVKLGTACFASCLVESGIHDGVMFGLVNSSTMSTTISAVVFGLIRILASPVS